MHWPHRWQYTSGPLGASRSCHTSLVAAVCVSPAVFWPWPHYEVLWRPTYCKKKVEQLIQWYSSTLQHCHLTKRFLICFLPEMFVMVSDGFLILLSLNFPFFLLSLYKPPPLSGRPPGQEVVVAAPGDNTVQLFPPDRQCPLHAPQIFLHKHLQTNTRLNQRPNSSKALNWRSRCISDVQFSLWF